MENNFAGILKALRAEDGIGQVELARRIKVSQGMISMWENGHREPTMNALIQLSHFFGVTIDYLVGLEKD